MDKVKKSLGSIMFSCTCNVALAGIGFYLLYLLFGYLNDNWEPISTSIISFMNTFIPLKNFLFAHLGKIFIGWVIIALWVGCVSYKMDQNEIEESSILNFILFLLFPIGSILCFMIPFQLGWEWFPINIISFLAAVFLFLMSIALVGVFFSESSDEKVEINTPEQLELFDKK